MSFGFRVRVSGLAFAEFKGLGVRGFGFKGLGFEFQVVRVKDLRLGTCHSHEKVIKIVPANALHTYNSL